jgi:hypothetical protein
MMADLGGYVDPDTLEEIQRCEEQIRQRIPRGDGLAVRTHTQARRRRVALRCQGAGLAAGERPALPRALGLRGA